MMPFWEGRPQPKHLKLSSLDYVLVAAIILLALGALALGVFLS